MVVLWWCCLGAVVVLWWCGGGAVVVLSWCCKIDAGRMCPMWHSSPRRWYRVPACWHSLPACWHSFGFGLDVDRIWFLSAAPKQAPKQGLVRRLSTQIQGPDPKIQGPAQGPNPKTQGPDPKTQGPKVLDPDLRGLWTLIFRVWTLNWSFKFRVQAIKS